MAGDRRRAARAAAVLGGAVLLLWPAFLNGYPLVFAGLTPAPAPFYLTQSVGPVPTRRAFSAGFSFGFR